ncbi:MAG TPA: FtsH protease activity modulator HflK [Firmicutes bacterium]|nr:FtsH protease activity modulator HflK [Bacillota bacterium]
MNNFTQDGKIFYQNKKPKFEPKKIRNIVIIVVVAIAVLALAGTCWYTVDEKQQAVVTTFGKATDVTGAGMHFKLPFGIQQVQKVDVNVYQKIEIGYRSTSNAEDYEVVEKESKMITGDYNIVNVDFFVEYKISDPVKYLYNSKDPVTILKNLIQSQIRAVVGSASVDAVLTDGKTDIQMRVKELVAEELEVYDIGLTLTDIKIQDSEPPTTSVIEAFKAVETAKQGAETAINQAKAYSNSELPKAQANADQLIQNAEYLKQNRINEAVKQVALFEAMYDEYSKNPEITKIRMYYEMIEQALPGVKLYIDVSDGSTQKLLPLENFVSSSTTVKTEG